MKPFQERQPNIVFPVSGRGRRFEEAGFDLPKPLIPVRGKPMIEWAVRSCDFWPKHRGSRLIFTVQREHCERFEIDRLLREKFATSIVIPIDFDRWPKGQAGHTLAAKEYIDNDEPLFIYSCDTFARAPVLPLIEREDPDGILPCFRASGDRFSYARLDDAGYVCETAEKRQISDLATNGHYYFRRGADFVTAVEAAISAGAAQNGEYYVAPLYNQLIGLGRKIRTVLVEENWEMGTPAELEKFLRTYPVE